MQESVSLEEEGQVPLRWVKSSACATSGCVEVAFDEDSILVRNSVNPAAGQVMYTRNEWVAFVTGVKRGEFDITG